jgi:hypothetical protein
MKDSNAQIQELVTKFEKGDFQGTYTQRALGMEKEPDFLKLYDQFAAKTLNDINLAPFVAKIRELANTGLPDPSGALDPKTGKIALNWKLDTYNPHLRKFFNDWANNIEGKPNFTTGKTLDKVFRTLNQNSIFATISGNAKTIMIQPDSLLLSMHKTGVKNTLLAIKMHGEDLLPGSKTTNRLNTLRGSEVLDIRKNIAAYGEFADAVMSGNLREVGNAFREGRSRDVQTGLAKLGLNGVQFVDMETSILARTAALLHGENELKLSGRDLQRYADDAVVETQHGGLRSDQAPVMQNELGRLVFQFQSFTIGRFNAIEHDILGIRNPDMTTKRKIINVAKLMALTTAYNIVSENIFHVPSGQPAPIREAMKEKKHGPLAMATAAALSIGDYIPGASSLRYGKGLAGSVLSSLGVDLPAVLLNKPHAPSWLDPVGKAAGIPYSGQVVKYFRSPKGRSVYDRLMGYRDETPTEGSGGGLKSGLGSGLKGSGLKSGLK